VPTFRLDLEYDGGGFRGWQSQAGGGTVQQALEEALAVILREPTGVSGAGRTDAGVHARGQVAHFRTEVAVEPLRLRRALEGLLPPTLAILEVRIAHETFHARFDAIRRAYRYHVATQSRAIDRHMRWRLHPAPDFDRMNRAAEALLGKHDFSAFCIAASETRNRTCTLARALWVAEDRPGDWRFEIEADRFLHGMVRAIVGTLVEVGAGRRDEADVPAVLASRDRRRAGRSAPAHGLVLERVDYDEDVARDGSRAAGGETHPLESE
jgi:tRNA pseudouridine38-40 synthase